MGAQEQNKNKETRLPGAPTPSKRPGEGGPAPNAPQAPNPLPPGPPPQSAGRGTARRGEAEERAVERAGDIPKSPKPPKARQPQDKDRRSRELRLHRSQLRQDGKQGASRRGLDRAVVAITRRGPFVLLHLAPLPASSGRNAGIPRGMPPALKSMVECEPWGRHGLKARKGRLWRSVALEAGVPARRGSALP